MSLNHSPKIVTDGLVLCLDAGDPKSYNGSGTTWYDRSGNENHGTLVNGPTYSSANGGSIVFDGSNDYANCGNSSSLNLSSFTASSWIYPKSLSTRRNIISKEESSNWIYAIGSTANKITFWIYNTVWVPQVSQASLSPNTWVYITVSYNGTDKNIFINGILDSTQTAAGMTLKSSTNLIIGAKSDGTTYFFDGNMGQISLYNRALSPAEILQNYKATKSRFQL